MLQEDPRAVHEMSIAIELVRELEAQAAAHGLERVEAFTVKAGALRAIVPEALEMAFAAAAEGTRAQGALLRLEVVPPVARCRACGRRFEPQADSFLCQACGQADVEVVEGNEVLLTSITGE